jgi:hypothetical protein
MKLGYEELASLGERAERASGALAHPLLRAEHR